MNLGPAQKIKISKIIREQDFCGFALFWRCYSSAMTWRYAFCINLIDVLPEKLYN